MLDHVELLNKLEEYCGFSAEEDTSPLQAAVLKLQLSANGDNWSVDERQMLSMARFASALSAIIVMDETTAAMDHETEHKLSIMIARS